MAEVKRPYPRTAPCAIMCRGDGNQVAAMIGGDPHEGCWGFGDDLPSALRNLADELEREVGQEPGRQVLEAYAHLGAALSQTIPSDDQIIMGHVRDAHALLREVTRG